MGLKSFLLSPQSSAFRCHIDSVLTSLQAFSLRQFLKIIHHVFNEVLNHNFVFVSFMLCVPAMVRSFSHQFHREVVGSIPGHSLRYLW